MFGTLVCYCVYLEQALLQVVQVVGLHGALQTEVCAGCQVFQQERDEARAVERPQAAQAQQQHVAGALLHGRDIV